MLLRLALTLPVLVCAPRQDAPEPVTRAEFERLHRELQPGEQAWLSIPWRLDLIAARAEAAVLERSLFLWSMNGHPLGCT
ncbi:MAG: hypothetical protein GY711_15585 [bacterium]|nr:hypothetical protein [bacterium]